MNRYEIQYERAAAKAVGRLHPQIRLRVLRAIGELATDPRPDGVKKLTGRDAYRIRVGDYRVIYEINDGALVVWVVRVAARGDAYKE